MSGERADSERDAEKGSKVMKEDLFTGEFNQKQNKRKTDIETWLMDAVPELFGVDDSDELPECLQEDDQADFVDKLCRAGMSDGGDKIQGMIGDWLEAGADAANCDNLDAAEFCQKLYKMVKEVYAAGSKK
mmetsp:Transcript_89539/g.140088  ORF Transcript_89539/g.140088 Transcript_89539/m.140088 type:complete len:131 (-) Transcript_89539:114-506(-)|eukprot:CAMPEP_0169086898 /NCGR_PEP_ID=MMETSP1015-20121227/13950_1 /TAXON_ID=342587 /ORGANISM="Karlodinium micrum, Strain CCMP2283" /LENGTH=130 /DNA_ID=CAMNT_0009147105 /DNA_START=84 /DNA_END=476 /DNA_ORIENTATION=-